MNLAELRTRVRSLTAILAESVLPDEEIDAFLNEAHLTICTLANWPFLVASVDLTFPAGVSVQEASLPEGRTAERVIDVFARTETGEKPWELFERYQPTIEEDYTGRARDFLWNPSAETITVFPVPNEQLLVRVRFVLDPATLTEEGPIDVPEKYRHAVSYLAASHILQREADTTERPVAYANRAQETVENMKRVLMTSSRPSVILGGRRSHRRSTRQQVW